MGAGEYICSVLAFMLLAGTIVALAPKPGVEIEEERGGRSSLKKQGQLFPTFPMFQREITHTKTKI